MKYGNDWLKEKYNKEEALKYLFFWGHAPSKDGSVTKSCFSQWWNAPFEVEGVTYKTAEHWMMAEKARVFGDTEMREKAIQAATPHQAKKVGRMVRDFNPVTWNEEKFGIVVAGNMYKYSQHPALKTFLLNTEDRILVEASPMDKIWGIGLAAGKEGIENPYTWKGENLLGYALMEVRDRLK
ncbi:hypothetical protein SAMN05421788_108242 [Filimonas lacunae]|uniref:NADAR domain-containing protein n=1 Tax=Filimonas lacunae TaxID=477680 RepID=A0A173MDE6_9BACT|nr:NADAR family protein [Filimonas lacunae]BAV05613.1 hypothetical protein FLA_1624 [Filimonas lacunae]SIT29194.1 hypothetical protein SAMN05421788_108242 [Filimonas lacunae]